VTENSALRKPSRIADAQRRLDSAVAQLEAVLKRSKGSPIIYDQGRNTAEDDSAAMQAEVEDLKRTNAQVKQVNKEVAGRLDKVIEGLRASLDC
tara:strand:- start:542 stop:823 length:282 start_codon:yes stop_codon:yes gene_type:complete